MRGRALIAVAALAVTFPESASATSWTDGLPVADIFGIGKALLGGLEITADFFKDMFLALFGGLADMLVPDSWAKKGREMLIWIASVPNYTRPAFGDLHTVSDISLWLGLAMLPVTLGVTMFLPSLGLTSSSDSPAAIAGRTLGAAAGMVLWSSLWSQGAALCNNISASYVLSQTATDAMNAYLELIAVGGLLGGVQILGILIVLVAGLLFLAGLVMKVLLLLLGAMLFATGPLLLGLAPTERGARLGRSWFTALLMTWALPVMWGLVLVVSGILIDDAKEIGVAIGGRGSIASTGGTVVAGCAAIAGPLLCMSLTRSLLGPLGSQFVDAASKVSPARLMGQLKSAPGVARGGPGRSGAPRAVASPLSRGMVGGVRERLMQDRRRAGQAARAAGDVIRTATPGAWGRVATGFAGAGSTSHQRNAAGRSKRTGRANGPDSSSPTRRSNAASRPEPDFGRADENPRERTPRPAEHPDQPGGARMNGRHPNDGPNAERSSSASRRPDPETPSAPPRRSAPQRRSTPPASNVGPRSNPADSQNGRDPQQPIHAARRAKRMRALRRPRPDGDGR